MSEMNAVRLEYIGDLASITFDQPESRANTLSTATWNQFGEAIRSAAQRDGITGLILKSGKEGMFLAGADLKELHGLPADQPEPTQNILRLGHHVLAALESVPFPTVAAIDGACLGGGMEVALACDYRICGMHPKIKIGLPEVKLGLIPGWGGTQRLPRIVGFATGTDLLIAGKAMSANEAWQVGIVDVIHASEDLFEAAVRCLRHAPADEWKQRRSAKQSPIKVESMPEMEQRLEGLPPDEQGAARSAHRVIQKGCTLPLSDGCEIEVDAFFPLLASETARNKLAGFLKK